MKKVFLMFMIAAFAMSAFVSCKKGANDPSVSLNSRNSRLMGDWKLTAMAGTNVWHCTVTDSNYTTTYAYNGTTYTRTTIPYTAHEIANHYVNVTATYSFDMTIGKDGAFSTNEVYSQNGAPSSEVWTYNGYWYWDGNDNDKIAVNLPGAMYYIAGSYSGHYEIDRLASKELILTYIENYVDNGVSEGINLKYTFEAK
jgi:hypothetical protein